MVKNKVPNKSAATGSKKMILEVDAVTHRWIKAISEQTSTTQPHIVNLILSEAIKNEPTEYIARIQKNNAKKELQKLEDEIKAKETEHKRLTELLKS